MTETAFDSARFRQVLGHFPTGVTVITGILDGEPVISDGCHATPSNGCSMLPFANCQQRSSCS